MTSSERVQAPERDRSFGELRARVAELERQAVADRELIAVLEAEGVVRCEKLANLEVALGTSRTIGAAVGILMNRHRLTQDSAFELLTSASQNANRKLRLVADYVVATGEFPAADRPGR